MVYGTLKQIGGFIFADSEVGIAYLQKPFGPRELRHRIRDALIQVRESSR